MEETTLDLTDPEIRVLIAHQMHRCVAECVYCEEDEEWIDLEGEE